MGLLKWLFGLIENLVKDKFTGNLRINFFKGSIANINKEESILPPKEEIEK